MNVDCRLDIPESKIQHHHQSGFTAKSSHILNNEYGILARVAMQGLGGELSWASERSGDDIYHFRSFDTVYFTPKKEYLDKSMNEEDVRDYIESHGYAAVYMITGLKIARGPSVKMSNGRKTTFNGELGVQQPGGLPVELGPKLNVSKEARMEMGFEDSDDFIFGIRVRKLAFKKHWLTRIVQDGVVDMEYNARATMYSDEGKEIQQEGVLDLGDEYELEEQTQVEVQVKESDGEGTGEVWVLTSRVNSSLE